jgi:hypothetical protein
MAAAPVAISRSFRTHRRLRCIPFWTKLLFDEEKEHPMRTECKRTAVFPATMLLVGGLACLSGVTMSCRQVPGRAPADTQWSPPVGVTVHGLEEGKWSLARQRIGSWPICCGSETSNVPPVALPGLPVRDSDYLSVSQDKAESGFLYRQSDGSSLTFGFAPQRLVLNGRTVTLDLSKDQEGWDWLAQAPANELAVLRQVMLPEELGTNTAMVAAQTLLLRKLANANPGVGLMGDGGTNPVLRATLAGFRPRTLIVGCEDTAAVTDLLAAFGQPSQLDTLFVLDAKKFTSLAFLRNLPVLQNLSLAKWDPAKTGPIPATCIGLRTLDASIETDSKPRLGNLAATQSLAGLESLTLSVSTKTGMDLDGLVALQKLREFSLCCETNVDLRPLQYLPCLTSLGVSLDKDAVPGEFAALLKAVPGVRHLEIYTGGKDTNNAASLAPVASLPDLESLTVIGTCDPDSLPLQKLSKLRFLALSAKQWETKGFATQITLFQQAHPDCRVVTCEPICLGSGWILLLALTAAASCWVRVQRRGVVS